MLDWIFCRTESSYIVVIIRRGHRLDPSEASSNVSPPLAQQPERVRFDATVLFGKYAVHLEITAHMTTFCPKKKYKKMLKQ